MTAYSLENFDKNFPKELNDLFLTISREGYALCLVGGAVRDFLLNKTISKDLDFEIRHKFEFTNDEWLKKISFLGERLSSLYNYDVEELKFSILRIKVGEFEVELSSPREEVFSNEKNESLGHSDFDATFSSKLTYSESFKRRDFTVNAIGIEFGVTGSDDEFKLIDPFNGVDDLNSKTLRPVGENFYKDPVRYLRTLRFKKSLSMELSRELKEDIVYFNLDKLSVHYFLQEGKKIGLGNLIEEMEFSKRKFAVKLPLWANLFSKIDIKLSSKAMSIKELLFFSSNQLTKEELLELASSLKIKKSVASQIFSLKGLVDLNIDSLITKSKSEDFSEFSKGKDLELLARFSNQQDLNESYILKSVHESISDLIKGNLRGEVEFKKKLQDVTPKLRSSLGIYCHLRNY
jgi:tRNA nucleotidyltransferase (CCA-adding enzyme)